jgi:hypothetical protein
MSNKYVLVTAISTHRMRYCIPLDELQKLNEEQPVDPKWALDCVVMNEIEEFSQDHLGEQIVDYDVLTEEEIRIMITFQVGQPKRRSVLSVTGNQRYTNEHSFSICRRRCG